MKVAGCSRFLLVFAVGAMAVACFSPTPQEGVQCGPDNSCPSGLSCNDGTCWAHDAGATGGADAGPDAATNPDAANAAQLAIAPGSHDFGAATVGSQSAAVTFQVSNDGGSTTGVLATSLADVTHFSIISDTCAGVALAPSGTCDIQVRFEPGSAGDQQTDLTVTGDPGGSTQAMVAGTGLTPGDLTITPTPHDFGSVTIGQESATQAFTVENTGGTTTGSITTTLADASNFTKVSDTCNGATLAAGATCVVNVRFTPGEVGALNTTLTVSASPGGDAAASLSGTSLSLGQLSMTPPSFDFGSVTVGNTSAPQTFTVENTGGSTSGTITTVLSDTVNFAVVSDSCHGNTLGAGATCTVQVEFRPGTAGSKNTSLGVSATPGGTQSSTLAGAGLSLGDLTITPTPDDFGAVTVGQQSGNRSFVVENTGGSTTGTMTTTLLDTVNFSVVADGCDGMTLGAAATCTIQVRFQPGATGAHATTLTVSATPGGDAVASLSGTGLSEGKLSISPSNWDFGTVTVGGTSSSRLFIVSNTGESPTGTIATALGDMANFAVIIDNCSGNTLAAGASCSIEARFEPGSSGALNTDLTVSATPGNSASSAVTGTGQSLGDLSISPTPHSFGSVLVGGLTAPQTFTVSNDGGSPTGTISISLDDTTNFVLSSDTCNGITLAAGATCTLAVRFRPGSAGGHNASLTASATPGGSASASLGGTGLAPANLSIAPATHGFGSVMLGSTSAGQTFVVSNTGDASSGAVGVSLQDSSHFVLSNNTCAGVSLVGGGTCTVRVAFSPTAGGTHSTSLIANASPGGTATSSLSGTAIGAPALDIAPTSHSFGTVPVGGSSASTTFTVSNTGGATTGVLSVQLLDNVNYTIVVDGCSGSTLATGAACEVDVAFTPGSTGQLFTSLEVSASPGGMVSATLTGSGSTVPVLELTPMSWDFGGFESGCSGCVAPTATFSVSNTGGGTTGVLTVTLDDMVNFSVTSDTCDGSTLGSGSTCSIDVEFRPFSTGSFLADLSVSASPGGSVSASLSGTGLRPAKLEFTPMSHDFGTVARGEQSMPQLFQLENVGEVKSGTIAITLDNVQDFELTSDSCSGLELAANETCTVEVTFTPITDEEVTMTTQLNADASPGGPAHAQLEGYGDIP